MRRGLDMDKIARALGAARQGKVSATGGYFGSLQLLADIETRFRVPSRGGRATDPNWTERRLVPLAAGTLARLEELAAKIRQQSKVAIEPMQLAGLLLEKTTQQVSDAEAENLLRPRAARSNRRATRRMRPRRSP
jgi:hypothetical protein